MEDMMKNGDEVYRIAPSSSASHGRKKYEEAESEMPLYGDGDKIWKKKRKLHGGGGGYG